MLVIDRQGHILFANPMAAHFAARPRHSLVGLRVHDLVQPESQKTLDEVIQGFASGRYPVGVDFRLKDETGPGRITSVNFSGVLRQEDAVLAAMRDVTNERAIAGELSQTKEFLERVIESSVDGIVSADLRGNIVLYNQAASRLFGYRKDEVLGKMTVNRLYPAGVAHDVMKRIKSKEYGGRGRLREYRVDLLTHQGERIPVTLSASLVLDGKKPVGTVGIFTDIRQKLAMESRLARAQKELQAHEKQSAIAELAGAAAHELNQPLTSVMGYAEFLKRGVQNDVALTRAVEVILRETDRMADIVRKVGQITRYETKPYVGGAKIVDLDASSSDE